MSDVNQATFRMADAVSVELHDSSRREEWNQYVSASPAATFAHDLGWKAVVEQTYGHRAFYLMAYRRQRVAGVLPLFLVRSILFNRSLVTSPYLTFGGIVSDDDEAACALVEKAKQVARAEKAKYVEIRNDKPCPYLPDTKLSYYTLILDLSPGPEQIWKSALHPTARRNVRKAEEAGLEIVEGKEYLDEFIKINFANMRRLGTPAHGRRFFRNIVNNFPESILLMVRHGRIGVGGTLLVPFRQTIFMPWVASLEEYFQMRPNNLLYWQAIVRACRRGFRYFDFGRSKQDQGTFRFKSQYGAQPVQLYYQFHLNGTEEIPDIDPDSPAFRPVVALWRRLPLPVVNFIGPHLIGRIP